MIAISLISMLWITMQADQHLRTIPSVQVTLICSKTKVKVGEPVSLNANLVNRSQAKAWLDARIVYKHHLLLDVRDDSGAKVTFAGSDSKIRLAPARRDSFIALGTNVGILRENFVSDQLRFARSGRYTITLSASHGASEIYAHRMDIELCAFGPPSRVVVTVTR